jgi:hypothetical protein
VVPDAPPVVLLVPPVPPPSSALEQPETSAASASDIDIVEPKSAIRFIVLTPDPAPQALLGRAVVWTPTSMPEGCKSITCEPFGRASDQVIDVALARITFR